MPCEPLQNGKKLKFVVLLSLVVLLFTTSAQIQDDNVDKIDLNTFLITS
jgi:hypothetical protein